MRSLFSAGVIAPFFDFLSSTTTGWSTGSGDPLVAPYPFTWHAYGGTKSTATGPSGSISYYYAETSSPRVQGDTFTLSYDGSECLSGEVVSTVAFRYHMYGSTMGQCVCARS